MNTLQPHPVCRPTFPILHLRHLAGTPIQRKLAWIEQQAELQILCDWWERGGSNARSGPCAVVRQFSWLFRVASYGRESGRKRNKGFVKESECKGEERKCDFVCHSLECHLADVIWWDKMVLSLKWKRKGWVDWWTGRNKKGKRSKATRPFFPHSAKDGALTDKRGESKDSDQVVFKTSHGSDRWSTPFDW